MNQLPLASVRRNGSPAPTVLAAIDALESLFNGQWARRVEHYKASAQRDRQLYAWLEDIGQMPQPGQDVSKKLLKAWRAQCAAQHAAQPTHTNRATS